MVNDMQYTRLGNTGLTVSRLCLGCMSFGSANSWPWVLDQKESIEIIREAYERGVNFFDTADVYCNGESERVLGKALKEIGARRERIVIATKLFMPVFDDISVTVSGDNFKNPEMVNRWGLSRKHIFDAVDASLERLGVDYIDLYQIHRFDPYTPVEETMEALNDLVRSGKVRYIGASTMATWEFQKMNYIAEKNGWTKFVCMQNCYNLLYREEEREMVPYCQDAGIGLISWSPLAGGSLIGKNRSTKRGVADHTVEKFHPEAKGECNDIIVERVSELASKYGASNAQISLAWQFTKKYVTSPIIGCTKLSQLQDSLGALSVKLTEEDVKYLEEAYTPKAMFTNPVLNAEKQN